MTKTSRTFNRKIELWQVQTFPDGFGGTTLNYVKVSDIWANVRDVFVQNYDTIGISQNRIEKVVTVRKTDLNTNSNLFLIGDKAYQINDIRENYKATQFECFCEATDFERPGNANTVLVIGSQVLTINTNVLTL